MLILHTFSDPIYNVKAAAIVNAQQYHPERLSAQCTDIQQAFDVAAKSESPSLLTPLAGERRRPGEIASHDKGGHREKALKLVRRAIEEVKAGIAYDNRH